MNSNKLVELAGGRLEVHDMPTWLHQLIVKFLFAQLNDLVESRDLGTVMLAPLPLKLFPGTIREPDLFYVSRARLPAPGQPYPTSADMVIEVVSDDISSRARDYEHKRLDYAKARIPEYWIVDPLQRKITVLSLSGDAYQELGNFEAGSIASGKLISEFRVDVDKILAIVDEHLG